MNTRPPSSRGKQGPEFTSNQLIVGICIFLVAALVCFMLGVVVGKFDTRAKVADQPQEPDTEHVEKPGPVSDTRRGLEETPREGTQAYPRYRPIELPAAKPAAPIPSPITVPARPTIEPTTLAKDSDQATRLFPEKPEIQLPQLPEPPSAPAAATPSVEASESAQEKSAQAPPETPSKEARLAAEGFEARQPAAAEAPAESPIETVPASEPAPTSPEPEFPESRPGEWAFGVQVASFAGPNREQAAQDYKLRLEASSDLKAMLMPSEDGRYLRVVVGGYPDRKTAERVCKELRKQAEFTDCFVKSLK